MTHIEPDLAAVRSGALNWTRAHWRWLAACAGCLLLGLVL